MHILINKRVGYKVAGIEVVSRRQAVATTCLYDGVTVKATVETAR